MHQHVSDDSLFVFDELVGPQQAGREFGFRERDHGDFSLALQVDEKLSVHQGDIKNVARSTGIEGADGDGGPGGAVEAGPYVPAPGQFPQAGYATTQAPTTWYDQNAGRPARQMQWSIGLQREISHDLAIEANYVGNRGVWWNAPGLIDVNALTPQRIAAAGLNINNPADVQLLASPLSSALAISRGIHNH